MTNKEKLRKAIIDVVPGIMPDVNNLKFGDKVKHAGHDMIISEVCSVESQSGIIKDEIHVSFMGEGAYYPIEEIEAVIPRPITLTDFIRAADEACCDNVRLDLTGNFLKERNGGWIVLWDVVSWWDLTNDNFDNQSPEFYRWGCEVMGLI
jgi:hypothetical protein